MDIRMRISSLKHKIVDKKVTTIVIKINNVEYLSVDCVVHFYIYFVGLPGLAGCPDLGFGFP